MNNSKLALESSTLQEAPTRDIKPLLRQREGELVKLIETVLAVADSEEWKLLKKIVFDGVVSSLEREMSNETSKKDIDPPTIYRLQGQLGWAKKYSKLEDLAQMFKVELEKTRNTLNTLENVK